LELFKQESEEILKKSRLQIGNKEKSDEKFIIVNSVEYMRPLL